MKNIFDIQVAEEVIGRINELDKHTKGLWGKMDVGQMLAHCNVTYELVYDHIHAKPHVLKRMVLIWIVKNAVVNEKPYKKNIPTGPEFKIQEKKDFAGEKERLIDYIKKTQQLGQTYFDKKESHSFGPLSGLEWNNMFYKHLDHHLIQFGV